MGEVIEFVPKAERERIRLIREARALYESIFPPAAPTGEQRDKAPTPPTISGAAPRRGDGARS
jgi:hypothetical protein